MEGATILIEPILNEEVGDDCSIEKIYGSDPNGNGGPF